MSDTPEQPAAVQVPAVVAPVTQEPADDFDKDRAMATIRKLREFEKTAAPQLRRLAELEAAEQAKRDADLSEAEKLRKQFAELEAKHAQASADLQRLRLIDAAQRIATKEALTFHDGALADAFALGAFASVEYDESGDPRNLLSVVRAIAKDRPWLLRTATPTGADLDARAKGTSDKKSMDEARRDELAVRFRIPRFGGQ